MMKLLGLEAYKLRRKRILLMLLLFMGAELAWMFLSMSIYMARHGDSAPWDNLLVLAASLNGLFLPILCAVVVSRLCDMEHKGNTWSLLAAASVKSSSLYLAKFICANLLLLVYTVLQAAALAVFGIVSRLDGPPPVALLTALAGGTALTQLAVTAAQLWLSTRLPNQSFALCLGMLGGFAGMTAGFFPAAIRRILPWAYYTELSPIKTVYDSGSVIYELQTAGVALPAVVLLMAIIIYLAGSRHASRQEY